MLRGASVLLRAIEREDLPGLHELVNDLEIESLASDQRPVPTSLAELQARFDARAADPPAGVIRFVIEVDGVRYAFGCDVLRMAVLNPDHA